jgi:small subunit ribosomal protein S2
VDTNCNPTPLTLSIPGNDDAIRAIRLFSQKISEAVLEGLMARVDAGEIIDLPPAAEALREQSLAAGDDEGFEDDEDQLDMSAVESDMFSEDKDMGEVPGGARGRIRQQTMAESRRARGVDLEKSKAGESA